MTTTPSPRLRAARRAGSMLAAGLGAALVTVAVVAGRRPRTHPNSRAGRSVPSPPPTRLPRPTPRPTPATAPAPVSTTASAPDGRPVASAPAGSTVASAPAAVPDGSTAAGPTPGSASAPAAPPEPELPLGFLSELHERFRADIDAEAVPSFDRPPPGEPVANGAPPAPTDRPPLPRRTGPVPVVPDPPPSLDAPPPSLDPPAPVPEPLSTPEPAPAPAREPAPAPPEPPAPGGRPDTGDADRGQRVRRVVGAVVVTAVFVIVVAAIAIGRSGDEPEAGTSGGSAQTEAGASSTASVPPPTPQEAFSRAGERLRTAGSFAYAGGSHARDVSRVRPGLWLAVDVMIAGQVDLASGRVHETGVAQNGGATETITAGPSAWGRSASSPAELAIEPYRVISQLTSSTPGPMGAALVPTWLAFATGPEDAGPDETGRPTYRATLPAAVIGPIESGQEPGDAQIVLTLDAAGEPARVTVRSLPDGAELDLTLDISDIGAPVTITPPAP